MGKQTIFPLKRKENAKYVPSASIRMAKSEKSKLIKGIVILFLAGCHAGFYLMSDYSLWWLLMLMKKHLELKTTNRVPPHLKMHVQGRGAMADMYKAMVSMFDPVADVQFDTTPCLPVPYEPEWKIYDEIGIIFGICLFMVIFESYGLRLRHIICGCYYPQRERERAVWLYNHILKRRGGLLTFERRKMRKQHVTMKAEEKGSIRGKLAARYDICRKFFKFLGWERKSCLCCGREGKKADMDNFYHCVNGSCEAVYCDECYGDLNNLCTVCMNPIDYGDVSDYSEERDSSEDEEEFLKKKEEARRRREERERKRAENSPSKILFKFGFAPGAVKKGDGEKEKEDTLSELSTLSSSEPIRGSVGGPGPGNLNVIDTNKAPAQVHSQFR